MDLNDFYIGNECYLQVVRYLFKVIYFTCRKYDVTVTFMTLMSWNSVCCVCGEAWSSHWLMMQLTNGQHACVRANLFHTMLDAVGVSSILKAHYRSMKCDVLFSQGSASTLFRCKNYENQTSFSRVMITKSTATFLWITVYVVYFTELM